MILRRRHRMAVFAMGLLAALLPAGCRDHRASPTRATPATALRIQARESLVDLQATAPVVDADNFRLLLDLNGLADRPVSVEIQRADGQWTRPGDDRTDPSGLNVSQRRLEGTLHLPLKVGRNEVQVACRIDAAVRPAEVQPRFERDLRVRRFWTVKPRSQGAVWALEGTWQADVCGESATGKATGYFFPPAKPGAWNMGTWDGGLGLVLDMGTRRVNWNHVRLSVLQLEKPRDLRAFDGLALSVATARPRDDVEVSVWLREEDGSWYYVKSAVPLVESQNTAVLLFEDFVEAEWVSPTNHMDEDYVLDLGAVSHVAVGVVNPLGVGEVAFVLTSADLIQVGRDPPPPAAVVVTGRTLAVNGHEFIPPGIFGGYAPHLPQEYRPGCQRDLYAPRYPHIPRQMFVRFKGDEDFSDWRAVLRVLRGEDEKRQTLSSHLAGLLDERARRDIERLDVTKLKEPERVPRQVTRALNALLRRRDLYDEAIFGDADGLADEARSRLAAPADLTDTEVMELNRRLLEAVLPEAVKPLPPGRPAELFWIDCYGERKQPADLLLNAHWKRHLHDYGRDIAMNAKKNRYVPRIEFWNEPYLNWAERSRVHLRNRFYRQDLAKEGGKVAIKRGSRFEPYDVTDWPALVTGLKAGTADDAPPALKRVVGLLGRRATEALAGLETGAHVPDDARRAILGGLRDLLRHRDLYDADAFKAVRLPEAAKERLGLLRNPKPPRDDLETLNRALLTAVLPGVFAPDPALGPPEIVPHFQWVKDGKGGLKVIDTTAFTYWSGRGNGWIYDRMYEPFARGIKETLPEAQVIAGWGFRWNEDHWAAWDMLYRPTIDRNIRWIDGIHEHHYQGDTTAMNGAYEVLVAYGKTQHDKWLYCYNTETNDLIDAPARGRVDTPDKAKAATQYRRMVYNLRDLVYCVLQSPDKFIARTVIHCTHTPNATRVCFGLLKNLRGRLVETASDDPKVWCVAGIDGTDPRALPPGYDGTPELVVVVFNDHRTEREMDLEVRAPTGTEFAGGYTERTRYDKATLALDLERRPAAVRGRSRRFRLTLPERSAWKLALKLDGRLSAGAEVRRRQFFSPDILRRVARGKPYATAVAMDGDVLRRARRAWLRLVVEDVSPGEATVTVGGTDLAIAKARTADNVNRIVELPLDLRTLGEKTDVAFRVEHGNHAGYRVDMVSIVLEERDE